MKVVKTLLLAFWMLSAGRMQGQNIWIDSVKTALASQKEDKKKVWTLIILCDTYASSYPDTGFAYGQQAYKLSEKLDYDSGRLASIININSALYSMGNYTLELDYAFKLLPLAKRMNNIYATGFSKGAVGDSYLNLGEYRTALKYYKEVLAIGKRENLPELHRMYSGMSPVFMGLKQFDSALWYARKGYTLFKSSAWFTANNWDTWWSESHLYTTLGDAFAGSQMYDSALYFYRLSFPTSERVNMKLNLITAWNGMAEIFKQQHNYDSAKWYAGKILAEKGSALNPSGKQKAASLMAEIYEELHYADSTLKYLRVALRLKDSLFNREKVIGFQNILLKESEKAHIVETATVTLRGRYRLYFIIGGLIFLFIISFFMLRNRRIKQLQDIRNSIAGDLHDDIGSTLSSISIMNELAKSKSPEALPLLNAIGENTAAIQENMSDIVWTVNADNDNFENVLRRMNLFAIEITEAKNISFQFDSDPSLNATKLSMTQRKNIYLFFKEAINNAVKHSDTNGIVVNVRRQERHVDMKIMDNGKGFHKTENNNGNGMNNFKKRAEDLNAIYSIDSQPGVGTTVHLKFKVG